MIGGKGQFTVYIYLKKKRDYDMEFEEVPRNANGDEIVSINVKNLAEELNHTVICSYTRAPET